MRNAENICLNCEFQLETQLYCPNCGQKATIHNLSLKYILSSFTASFIDFDKKLLHSLKDIWVPNKVSQSFLLGARSTYVNHLRFFLICLAVLFGLIALNMKQLDFNDEKMARQSTLEKVYQDFNDFQATTTINCDTTQLNALKNKLFEELTTETDSTISYHSGVLKVNYSTNSDGIRLSDFYNLPIDTLLAKAEVEGRFETFLIRQISKILKNGSSMASFMVGNMLWGIILSTLLMALFLKLLYRRHHSFYTEHLMQMINFHCIFSLLMSIFLFIDLFTELHPFFYFLAIILSAGHFLVSLKRYYNQSWIKTLFKGVILFNAYIFCLFIVIMMVLGLSILFF